jgi:hypothetical protein
MTPRQRLSVTLLGIGLILILASFFFQLGGTVTIFNLLTLASGLWLIILLMGHMRQGQQDAGRDTGTVPSTNQFTQELGSEKRSLLPFVALFSGIVLAPIVMIVLRDVLGASRTTAMTMSIITGAGIIVLPTLYILFRRRKR